MVFSLSIFISSLVAEKHLHILHFLNGPASLQRNLFPQARSLCLGAGLPDE